MRPNFKESIDDAEQDQVLPMQVENYYIKELKIKVVEKIHEQLDIEKNHEKIMEDLIAIKIKIKGEPIIHVTMCPSIRLILLTIVHQLALLELRFSSWLSTIA